MKINNGPFPVGIRTKSSVALTGVAPANGAVTYVPMYVDGIYKFTNPSDVTAETVDAGGLVDYDTDQVLCVKEVRAHIGSGKVITVTICDRDGTNPVTIVGPLADGNDTVFAFDQAYVLLASQVIKIITNAAGVVDIYTVIGAK